MKKSLILCLSLALLVGCNSSGNANNGGFSYTSATTTSSGYDFSPYEQNMNQTTLINHLRTQGTTKDTYAKINGTYDYYSSYVLDMHSIVIIYFPSYSIYEIVVRNGSDIALTDFSFKMINSTNNGLLTQVNGYTFTQVLRVNNHKGETPYDWINEGIYDINVYCCEHCGTTLTD